MKATLRHSYEPRGIALEVFRCREPELLVAGPAGTGKSRACLEKVFLMCLVNPNLRALIVRKTQSSLGRSTLDIWRKAVVTEALEAQDVRYYGGSAVEPAQYKFTNNATVIMSGMDRRDKIMSAEFDIIFVDEAHELDEADWEFLTTRLRNGVSSFQQIIGSVNPQHPTHWLKLRADSGRMTLLNTRHTDNPRYYNADGTLTEQGKAYIPNLERLTGVRRARLFTGVWAAAEGIIYEDFNEAVHVLDNFEIPQTWPRFWTIDFGHTNPTVVQRWAEDPDGRLYLYAEYYRTDQLVEDVARHIKREVADAKEPRPYSVICDHDAEDRATFQRHAGIGTIAAHKKVLAGIEAVEKRLHLAKDGKPRLFILRNTLTHAPDQNLVDQKKPVCTLEELPGYIWRPGVTKEEPLKENDHGCDALRYMVAQKDLVGQSGLRWVA